MNGNEYLKYKTICGKMYVIFMDEYLNLVIIYRLIGGARGER